MEGSAQCKSMKGSPFWLAPEIANRSGHSYPADIWSLGCCALEMLTGRPPWTFQTTNRKKVVEMIAKTDAYPSYPEGLSDDCYDFLFHCCIVRNSQQRWTCEELLEHPFITNNMNKEDITQPLLNELLRQNKY